MNHRGTVLLPTERLELRRFDLTDTQAMFCNWASDTRVTKYLQWPHHQNIEVTKKILSIWCKRYQEPE